MGGPEVAGLVGSGVGVSPADFVGSAVTATVGAEVGVTAAVGSVVGVSTAVGSAVGVAAGGVAALSLAVL